jgi:hypothetical protein
MPPLLRRLSSINLLWQILVPILVCVAIGLAVVQMWTVPHTRSLLQERLTPSLNANLAMGTGRRGAPGKGERAGPYYRYEATRSSSPLRCSPPG